MVATKERVMRNAMLMSMLVLAGCAASNGYQRSYTAVGAPAPPRAHPAPNPELLHSSTPVDDAAVAGLAARGFRLVGYSNFSAEHPQKDELALEQGVAVGADLVVLQNPKSEPTTKQMPKTVVIPNKALTDGNMDIGYSGSGDTASTHGTLSSGVKTVYVPVTVEGFNYGAYYFVKQ
jgi:hypothetical protein